MALRTDQISVETLLTDLSSVRTTQLVFEVVFNEVFKDAKLRIGQFVLEWLETIPSNPSSADENRRLLLVL